MLQALYNARERAKNKNGFTLIELIVVIAILGILAAVLIPRFGGFQDKARSAQAIVDAKQIATALDGLLAEGTTPNATQVMDIADSEGDMNGTLTLGTGRAFTYVVTISGTQFTVTRNGTTGAMTVTWS